MTDLDRAVERLGQTLEAVGIPRMPARVFAFVLADDQETYTAAELARGLDVSPAAISGAVRYLTDTHLVVRERNPAGRGDLFRVRDGDIWGTIQASRAPLLDRIVEQVQEAVDLLPEGSPGRARVEETRDYFTFVRDDVQQLTRRWRDWSRTRRA
ncbi:GbsR/MarR family transcriptional regulator [Kineosporia sp. R_H_3]|uniref:GbsR/MarR family transcriptional regulator n=1 Tax=Kineosporia sp. R_H_3 TaxID=1961848 RepID=UPI00117A0580|nr:MarR family transcriptional regulator [Kineosporia sp. R_H_3]